MKVRLHTIVWVLLLSFAYMVGCKKQPATIDNPPPPPPPPPFQPPPPSYAGMSVITQSFTEDFSYVYNVLPSNGNYLKTYGWVFKNNSKDTTNYSGWWIGQPYSSGIVLFARVDPAYNGNPDDFAYAGFPLDTDSFSKASNKWMLTPPVALKNGDKISFYTKFAIGDTTFNRLDTLQQLEIRLNEADTTSDVGTGLNEVGKFSKVVAIVRKETPREWLKKEFTIEGLAAPINSRIAFRYYFPHDSNKIYDAAERSIGAIAIDALQFTKQ